MTIQYSDTLKNWNFETSVLSSKGCPFRSKIVFHVHEWTWQFMCTRVQNDLWLFKHFQACHWIGYCQKLWETEGWHSYYSHYLDKARGLQQLSDMAKVPEFKNNASQFSSQLFLVPGDAWFGNRGSLQSIHLTRSTNPVPQTCFPPSQLKM